MIPVNEPVISQKALEYVTDCIKTGWISSAGSYIKKFEDNFASYLGVKNAVTTTSGTSALHLAIASLNIGDGDEVIIPALTMIAVPFAILYTGASCVPIDVDPDIYNIDPEKLEKVIVNFYNFDAETKELTNRQSNKKLKAIIAVHLYGHPCDMDSIMRVADKYALKVIEDAAQAHGAEYIGNGGKRRMAGSIADIACFSFYGNKIITTGEGGMLVTNDGAIAERARSLKDLAHSPSKRFSHREVGFNYRITNLQAAVGVAQLEEIDKFLKIKRSMAEKYNDLLSDVEGLTLPKQRDWAKSVYWMYAILVEPEFGISRDILMQKLKDKGVDSRSFFVPLDEQDVYDEKKFFKAEEWHVSKKLSKKGMYLPSGLALTDKQINEVCGTIKEIKEQN